MIALQYVRGRDLGRLFQTFYAGVEANIPTWYASLLLPAAPVAAGLLARAIRVAGGRYAAHWSVLAGILLFMSLDESATVHEQLNLVGRLMLRAFGREPSGWLAYPWVFPPVLVVIALAAAYLPLLAALPRRQQRLIGLGGALFVVGALGLEVVLAPIPPAGHVRGQPRPRVRAERGGNGRDARRGRRDPSADRAAGVPGCGPCPYDCRSGTEPATSRA